MSIPTLIPSPCIKRCELDRNGQCLGCGRTLEEIARWTAMSAKEREQIMDRLQAEPRRPS